MDADLKQQWSGSVIRTRQRSPYFAVLLSYMTPVQVAEDSDIKTAATDAVRLYLCKEFFMGLTIKQRDGLLLHEMLHAALGHCWRVGTRHALLWNIACDYVVNQMIKEAGFELPPDPLQDDKYASRSAEEVYEMLLKEAVEMPCDGPGDVLRADKTPDELEAGWRAARANAATVSKMAGTSHSEASLIAKLEKPQLDWRRIIWQELSFAPSDYKGYDRRLIGDDLYIEALEPEETLLDVGICVDTSGSTFRVLGKFIAEVRQVCSMYPNTNAELWWQDTKLIGPIDIGRELEKPRGGGGTDFRPYFVEAEKRRYKTTIFLTDGYGSFPAVEPGQRVVWVVCDGGLQDEKFPWGEVVKIR